MKAKRKYKPGWDEILGIALLLLAVGLLAVSVFLCFSDDIWYDELFTMGLASQPFGELISITGRDVHPPLYYIIVKLFLMLLRGLGAGQWGAAAMPGSFPAAMPGSFPATGTFSLVAAAKLASVLPFFLCLLYGAGKVRRHFGLLAAGLFGFLLLAMPQLGGYTVEMRMYGYALFFVTAGMLHAYELALDALWDTRRLVGCSREEAAIGDRKEEEEGARRQKRKNALNWTALTLYALGACYTHYFACVAMVMIYGFLFLSLWKKGRLKAGWKAFFTSGCLCALAYLPWLVGAVGGQVGQVEENYWIQPVTWRTLGGCVKFLFQPAFSSEKSNRVLAVVLFAICAVLMGQAFLRIGRDERNQFAAGCVGVLAGIVLFGFGASLVLRPIFVYRYMLPAMGLFWLAFAILLSRLKEKKIVFFPVFFLLLLVGLRNYRAFYGEEMWKRVQMAQVQEAFSQIGKEDALVFNFDQAQAVVSFYLPNETYLWYGEPEELITEMYPQNHPLVEGEFSDETGFEALKGLLGEYERVWFLGSGNARDEIIEKWGKAGIEAQEQDSVMLERYWFNLYQLERKEEGQRG